MWHVSGLAFHTGITAAEVLAGFILGSLLGAFIGYLIGMSPTAEFALSPYILALQIAPKVAFAPLFILWMGFTVYPKILVAILIVFFPVMVNVLTAIRTVDPDLINLARAFKASRAQIFWKIEFPASLPPLFAGLRIGSTLAVVGVVVGELVGGNMGLGYLLVVRRRPGQHRDGVRRDRDAHPGRRHRLSAGDPDRAARAALPAQARADGVLTFPRHSGRRACAGSITPVLDVTLRVMGSGSRLRAPRNDVGGL